MKTTKNQIEITVAVSAGQWRKVQARLIPDLGPTPVALHRTLNRPGWSLTATLCGWVIARGPTQQACLQNYRELLTQRSEKEILDRIAGAGQAPSPANLTQLDKRTPSTKPTRAAEDVADAIAARAGLDPVERNAVLRALSKAGPTTGRLLKNPPVGYRDSLAQAAWNGIQPNPYKIQASSILFTRGADEILLKKLLAKSWPVWLDADAAALVDLGVW
jgi:hypothetical protein